MIVGECHLCVCEGVLWRFPRQQCVHVCIVPTPVDLPSHRVATWHGSDSWECHSYRPTSQKVFSYVYTIISLLGGGGNSTCVANTPIHGNTAEDTPFIETKSDCFRGICRFWTLDNLSLVPCSKVQGTAVCNRTICIGDQDLDWGRSGTSSTDVRSYVGDSGERVIIKADPAWVTYGVKRVALVSCFSSAKKASIIRAQNFVYQIEALNLVITEIDSGH